MAHFLKYCSCLSSCLFLWVYSFSQVYTKLPLLIQMRLLSPTPSGSSAARASGAQASVPPCFPSESTRLHARPLLLGLICPPCSPGCFTPDIAIPVSRNSLSLKFFLFRGSPSIFTSPMSSLTPGTHGVRSQRLHYCPSPRRRRPISSG